MFIVFFHTLSASLSLAYLFNFFWNRKISSTQDDITADESQLSVSTKQLADLTFVKLNY